jgi:general stress protein 26
MASLTDPLVRQFLEKTYVASLASQNVDGSIHMVAVWYWSDGARVFVATASGSRKARNLVSNPKISLMIDSRDPIASCGITIVGTAKILNGDASKRMNAKIYDKYLSPAAIADPKVGPVFAAWDDVTIEITPSSVISWDMREADRQVFGGSFEKNPTYMMPLQR